MCGRLEFNVFWFDTVSHACDVMFTIVLGEDVLFTYELFPPKLRNAIESRVTLNVCVARVLFAYPVGEVALNTQLQVFPGIELLVKFLPVKK
ncbi:Uncharacterised protein [uncultured archaeon]|nr:Uncharacterised protein [uncultured archaeon]